ncbi:MAG: GAP family protein [Actinomycetota bacterium]
MDGGYRLARAREGSRDGPAAGRGDPKNFLLEVGAGSALAVNGPSTSEAVVALIVFVIVGSLTIAGPVAFYLVGGDRAKAPLESAKGWLVGHNDAVMTVLFLVFGVDLIAKGIPPLTG